MGAVAGLGRRSLLAIAVTIAGCAAASAPHSGEEWRAHVDAGRVAYEDGDRPTAEREFRAALDVASVEKPPGLATAVALNALAVLYINDGRLSDAAPMLNEATRIFEERGATNDQSFALLLTNRAQLAFAQHRLVDAESESRRALAIAAVPKTVHDRAVVALVASLCAQGRVDEAQHVGAELSIGCSKAGREPGP